MNNSSSKKHVVRDIPKFGSTKCFCDDGNLFKVKNLIHEADLWVLFCALSFIDQCLPNAIANVLPK
jgi:hypothetical protein